MSFRVSSTDTPNVVQVDCDVPDVDWEQYFLLRSDAHWDNPHSRLDLQQQHLEQAKERNAGIIDAGDLFCAMQGKWDPRASKDVLREEHQVGNYLDALVKTCADFHEPYADLWVAQGLGNHETSILKRHETHLIERWCQVMRDRTGAPVPMTGYSGWVRFSFRMFGSQQQSVRLWHFHGSGGGGPVTKDMIQRNRQLQYLGNADIVLTGHTHDQWVTKDMRLHLNERNYVEHRPVTVVKTPTYKDEYGSGIGGWHVGTGKPPKPLGAYWLRFYVGKIRRDRGTKRNRLTVKYEIREAEV